MKKGILCILALLLCLSLSFTQVEAKSQVNLSLALSMIQSYYKKQKVLSSSDEVMAVESIGLEAENAPFTLDQEYKESLKSLDTTYREDKNSGNFTKGIIALTLLGEDPTHYYGKNYVKTLEGLVSSNGTFDGKAIAPNYEVYVLMALEAVHSSKADLVAKDLASKQQTNGSFYYVYNGIVEDDSTTGWVVEALSVANKNLYHAPITKAVSYLKSGLQEDGSFDHSGWGGSPDTSAAVFEGLFIDHKNEVSSKSLSYLLNYQLKDGSFKSNYSNGETDPYTTVGGAKALGTYYYGSVINDARKEFLTTQAAHKLSVSDVTLSKKSFVYNGKVKKPSVKVIYQGKTLTRNKDYKLTLKKSKAIGIYKATIKGLGDYSGTVKVNYTIHPSKVKVKSIKVYRTLFNVKLKKAKGNVKYQIAYKKASSKKWRYKKTKALSQKVKKLDLGSKYQVKVRAYKTVKKKTIYGKWSKEKSVKLKA